MKKNNDSSNTKYIQNASKHTVTLTLCIDIESDSQLIWSIMMIGGTIFNLIETNVCHQRKVAFMNGNI